MNGLEEFLSSGAYFIENKILSEIIAASDPRHTLELQTAVDVKEPELAIEMPSIARNA